MAKKYQYGRGLYSLIFDGMALTMLIAKIKELRSTIDQSLMLHNLHEHFKSKSKKENKIFVSENSIKLKSIISPQINKINADITLINEMIKGLDFNHTIPKLKTGNVLLIVDRRMKKISYLE
jgi:hypothetical protein